MGSASLSNPLALKAFQASICSEFRAVVQISQSQLKSSLGRPWPSFTYKPLSPRKTTGSQGRGWDWPTSTPGSWAPKSARKHPDGEDGKERNCRGSGTHTPDRFFSVLLPFPRWPAASSPAGRKARDPAPSPPILCYGGSSTCPSRGEHQTLRAHCPVLTSIFDRHIKSSSFSKELRTG